MTSLHPLVAGERTGLPTEARTLAEVLSNAGYVTVAGVEDFKGLEGTLLLPLLPASRSKVRLTVDGRLVDLIARSDHKVIFDPLLFSLILSNANVKELFELRELMEFAIVKLIIANGSECMIFAGDATRLAFDYRPPGATQNVPFAPPVQLSLRDSLGNVAMPWAMESTRQGRGFVFYLTFVLFHLGVVAGISLAFVSTLAPSVMRMPVVAAISGTLLGAAFLISVYRVFRRLFRPVMRLISTPDDYFSLLMLTAWFGLGTLTQGYIAGIEALQIELLLVAYLYLTSFFLLYVPFSKISHYLYYPFTRWWIGKALGHRGSMPLVRG